MIPYRRMKWLHVFHFCRGLFKSIWITLLVCLIISLTAIFKDLYNVSSPKLFRESSFRDGADLNQKHTSLNRTCSPKKRIVFLKVHKTGSSTLANIFQRFGITNNLNFAIPRKTKHENGYNYIGKPGETLRVDALSPLPDGESYDILWNHVVYNRTAFHSVMPQDAIYISIIREPFEQFVSAFEYFKMFKIQYIKSMKTSNVSNPISAYLKNESRFEPPPRNLHHIRNKMVADFGMTLEQLYDSKKRISFLNDLKEDFNLVMIMEYFDESLILMKRRLCWSHKDILYFPKNRNPFRPHRIFDNDDYHRHREISFADYELYDFFFKEYMTKLLHEGIDLFEEVRHFKSILKLVWDGCWVGRKLTIPASKWSESFEVTKEQCHMMKINELSFLDHIMNVTSAKYIRFLNEKILRHPS